MNAKERLDYACNLINAHLEDYRAQAKFLVDTLKDILKPCGKNGCLVGSDDFCDDIFYVYAEPKPNEFYRVKAIRNNNDNLEVFLDLPSAGDYSYLPLIDGNWLDFDRARVVDLHLLADEVVLNLEFSDGYQEIEDNNLIDKEGNPYINGESFPAGGGLDKRCDYNADALFLFYAVKGYDNMLKYLNERGFIPGCQGDYEEWFKGNTRIVFEAFDRSLGNYGYMHTEFLEEDNPEGEEREYDVPFLRTQWADVRVKARSRAEAREKAEAMFREGKDGWIDWEDVDVPTFDNEHDITLAP